MCGVDFYVVENLLFFTPCDRLPVALKALHFVDTPTYTVENVVTQKWLFKVSSPMELVVWTIFIPIFIFRQLKKYMT